MIDPAASDKNEIFGDYKFSDTFFENTSNKSKLRAINNNQLIDQISYVRQPYTIPFNEVAKHVVIAEKAILGIKERIENNLLRKIYINPFLDRDLEEAHFRLWDEIKKVYKDNSNPKIENVLAPPFICFDELVLAEKMKTRAANTLIDEFLNLVSHTTFSHLYSFRTLINLIYAELICIKSSVYTDFGGGYESESQQKIAAQYYSWCKMATHYVQRISTAIITKPQELPLSEVDKITAKQAAQLQTVFALKLNATDIEVRNLLSSLKRDMIDNCSIFYTQYLSPSLRFTKDIVDKLEVEFVTKNMRSEIPFIAGEVYAANFLLKGNFISVYTDMIERIKNFRDKADNVLMYIREKRKYSNYINQLSVKAASKRNILVDVTTDLYSDVFKYTVLNESESYNFVSQHSKLDGLLNDDHPQYLLRSGGTIQGEVYLGPDGKIDGIRPSTHSHNGRDGSVRIKASDIDYSSDRDEADSDQVKAPIGISIKSFSPEILQDGTNVVSVTLAINYDAQKVNNHEFDISFVEVQ